MMLGIVGWELCSQTESASSVMPGVFATFWNVGACASGEICSLGRTAWQAAQTCLAYAAPASRSPSCASAACAKPSSIIEASTVTLLMRVSPRPTLPSGDSTGRAASPIGKSSLFLGVFGPKIRAPLPRQRFSLFAPPFGYRLVVAGQQHLGDGAAFPFARPRVVGIFEQALGEALLGKRAFIAGDAGQEPHAGIDQHLGRKLAARQHKVSDRDLLDGARVEHALVDALEAA